MLQPHRRSIQLDYGWSSFNGDLMSSISGGKLADKEAVARWSTVCPDSEACLPTVVRTIVTLTEQWYYLIFADAFTSLYTLRITIYESGSV
ncbi:hypothetical protein NPIL_378031 [Nephila pilipes]|uniref:Uncharacterized protein n=1 Tax=Nephila pilipes TaxID=299642 RepID=A0A8X6Q851_NEPPI|nr:hypothetical protein NPIL_378031 [Nephila pilipes]